MGTAIIAERRPNTDACCTGWRLPATPGRCSPVNKSEVLHCKATYIYIKSPHWKHHPRWSGHWSLQNPHDWRFQPLTFNSARSSEGPLLPSPSQLHGLCFSATHHYSKSFSSIFTYMHGRGCTFLSAKNNIYKCFEQIYTQIILQYIFWRVGNQSSRFVYMARLQHYALMHAVRVRLG